MSSEGGGGGVGKRSPPGAPPSSPPAFILTCVTDGCRNRLGLRSGFKAAVGERPEKETKNTKSGLKKILIPDFLEALLRDRIRRSIEEGGRKRGSPPPGFALIDWTPREELVSGQGASIRKLLDSPPFARIRPAPQILDR